MAFIVVYDANVLYPNAPGQEERGSRDGGRRNVGGTGDRQHRADETWADNRAARERRVRREEQAPVLFLQGDSRSGQVAGAQGDSNSGVRAW